MGHYILHNNEHGLQFPQQKVLCDNKTYSHGMLHDLLEMIYTDRPPFTGYLQFVCDERSHLFLFFFKGAPYAASIYGDNKPVYTIQDLGRELVRSADKSLSVSLCETDPILLKNMLLFLQKEPAIKAPTSLIDFEHIVRQIREVGKNAMIALCRDNKINFCFFKDGKGALMHYADQAFERPGGMTIDEEMLLYAFKPGQRVQAYIFRDMATTMAEDALQLDRDALYKLLTVGYLKDRRKGAEPLPRAAESPENSRPGEQPSVAGGKGKRIDAIVNAFYPSKLSTIVLTIETGPLQGDRFTVRLPCTIGRKGCDLILSDRLVSRLHAEIRLVDSDLVIEDLASTNGTKVNGTRITTSRLKANDLISIGPINLRITPHI